MKSHTRLFLTIGISLLSVALVAGMAGCDLGDLMRVNTPTAIAQTTGLPGAMSLNEAELEYEAWLADVQRAGASWRENIDRQREIATTIGQLTLQAFDTVGPTLAGVPVLGPILPAATGLLAYFLGTGRLRKQKEDSYNAGLKQGQTIATQAATHPGSVTPSVTPAPSASPVAGDAGVIAALVPSIVEAVTKAQSSNKAA